jgi:hypothetical protein
MDVTVFLEPKVDIERLSAVLDGLGHEGRVHTIRSWGKREQAAIFEAAKGFRKAELDFLVPSGTNPLVEVIHDGQNSLPTPGFKTFQKRFMRYTDADGTSRIAGYNVQPWAWFSGPGYFCAEAGEGEHAGELVFDYRKLPADKPASWPRIQGNASGTHALVYGGLVDYVRPISSHVSISRGYRRDKHEGWFALVRQDPG